MMPSTPFRVAMETTATPARRRVGRTDAVILVLLALTLLAAAPDNRRTGSTLQVVLPLVALGCAATRGQTLDSLGRFAVLQTGVKGLKHLTGDSPIGRRPDGGDKGFPSGHSAVAAFGAAQLVKHCAPLHPVTNAAAIASAALTAGSRIEAGRHSLWQAMAGAAWGWAIACIPLVGLRGAGRLRRRARGRHD